MAGRSRAEGESRRPPLPNRITLTVRQGPNPGQRFTAQKDTITIGRLVNNEVPIADRQISPHHARISWEGGRFVIRDLGSVNGTTVNGRPVVGPYPLRNGDVIGLGDVLLAFTATESTTKMPSQRSFSPPPMRPSSASSGSNEPIAPGEGSKWGKVGLFLAVGCLALMVIICVVGLVLFFGFRQVRAMQAPPQVRLIEPGSHVEVRTGQPVVVVASASDEKGVTKAEFWVDGALAATIPSPQPGGQRLFRIEQSWVPSAEGVHELLIKAYNSAGKASEPLQVSVNVIQDAPTPAVQALAPTDTPTPPPTPSPTPTPGPTATPATCNDDAAFVADITIPDNSIMRPGQRFTKTWRIRNVGTCQWENTYKLVFVSGSRLSAPESAPVVQTAAGGTADISVAMQAPGQPGQYTSIWQMQNAKGELFGQSLSVVIQIPAPPTPTLPPTNTPLPTNTPVPSSPVDLTVCKIQVQSGKVGQQLDIGVRVENVGSQASGKFKVTLRIANDDEILKEQSQDVDSLDPGKDRWVVFSYKFEEYRTYTLTGIADSTKRIAEKDENNNEYEYKFKPKKS